MNSPPLISHHLFVAAIGNERRAYARPTRQERPSAGAAAPASVIALEVLAGWKLLPSGATRTLRNSVPQVRS